MFVLVGVFTGKHLIIKIFQASCTCIGNVWNIRLWEHYYTHVFVILKVQAEKWCTMQDELPLHTARTNGFIPFSAMTAYSSLATESRQNLKIIV